MAFAFPAIAIGGRLLNYFPDQCSESQNMRCTPAYPEEACCHPPVQIIRELLWEYFQYTVALNPSFRFFRIRLLYCILFFVALARKSTTVADFSRSHVIF
jgi:hypothetical protein